MHFDTLLAQEVNRSVLNANQPYCLLLFGEIDISEDQIDALVRRMKQGAEIAAIQPKVITDEGVFSKYGGAGGFIDALGYWYVRGTEFQKSQKDEGQFDNLSDRLSWVSPPVILVRTDAFKAACGLDTTLDKEIAWVDLGIRFQLIGYSLHWYPEVSIVLKGKGTSLELSGDVLSSGRIHKSGDILTTGYFRSRLVVHYFESMVVPKTIMWIILDLLSSLFNLLRFDLDRCRAFAISAWSTFLHLPDWLKHRSDLQRTIVRKRDHLVHQPYCIYWYHHGKLGKTASNALAIFLVIASVFSLTMRDRR